MERGAWLADVMRRKVARFDRYGPTYDQEWGAISPTHRAYVARVVESVARGGVILDAACGTGRFFPAILGEGRLVQGVDFSKGMLAEVARKFPEVVTEQVRLQDLRFDGHFDGVICVDALENVPPEDWPNVLGALSRAARRNALVYMTIELPDDDLEALYRSARSKQWPVEPGELAVEEGYHYYPPRDAVLLWLDQEGLELIEQTEVDAYWHVLCRSTLDRSNG